MINTVLIKQIACIRSLDSRSLIVTVNLKCRYLERQKATVLLVFQLDFPQFRGRPILINLQGTKAHAVHPNSTKLKSNKQRSGGSLFVLLGYLLFNNTVHEFKLATYTVPNSSRKRIVVLFSGQINPDK